MRCPPHLSLALGVALFLCLPAGLTAQGRESPAAPAALSRRVAAVRLQAMLQAPGTRATARVSSATSPADVILPVPTPSIRLIGRTVLIPLTGPAGRLEFRAAMNWWSIGLRASAGFRLRF